MREYLEPALENTNQPSCEAILTVIKEIEDKYWSFATGPAAGHVFKKVRIVSCSARLLLASNLSYFMSLNFQLGEVDLHRNVSRRCVLLCTKIHINY